MKCKHYKFLLYYYTKMDNLTYDGSINLILGSMYSGKTTELGRRYRRHIIAGKKCVMIKYIKDTRYDKQAIFTHDNVKTDAVVCTYLYELNDIVKEYDAICIDEIQFYKDGHIMCEKWANQGKIIEASGLSGTFLRSPWPVVSNLIPKAESIKVLKAICPKTGYKAAFTKLLIENKTNEIEIIGGLESYIPVDRRTYFEDCGDKYIDTIIGDFVDLYGCVNDENMIDKIKNHIYSDDYNRM